MTKKTSLPDEELFAIAKPCRKELGKAGGLTSYTLINENGAIQDYFQQSCFGGLMNNSTKGTALFLSHNTMSRTTRRVTKNVERYLDWWVNRSIAAPIFVNHDLDDIITNAAVFDARKWPISAILMAAVGVRMVFEQTQTSDEWAEYVDVAGEDVAGVLSGLVSYYGTGGVLPLDAQRPHLWMHPKFSRETLRMIVNHDLSGCAAFPKASEKLRYGSFSLHLTGAHDIYHIAKTDIEWPNKLGTEVAGWSAIKRYIFNVKDPVKKAEWVSAWVDLNLKGK
jgi:hypothetical protein